ncbi:MAG TPA: PEGA domain-containing protein [Vicinamibacterales bacterium]|nr:PEGA domain-containing protein [Vicinamibacterales bacterium]
MAAALLLLPGFAQAQRQATSRQAVPRPVPSRPVHAGGVYRGPVVNRGYYASPYWYRGYYPYYGYGYPFAFSVGFGCCGYGYYGSPYYGYGYPYGYAYDSSASVRLQVEPREAEVFVDGYYAGTVDDFDGTFQRLRVEPGDHEVEVFLPGHRSYQQKVYLQPGKTFNVRHEMETLAPGDAEPVRPVVKARPTGQPSLRSRRHAPREGDPGEAGPEENAERAPERGPRSEFGSLALRVQPGDASIMIDGEPWQNSGDNERFVLQLGPGVHNVQIRKDGYRTYMTDINVRPGETTTLNVAMTPNK